MRQKIKGAGVMPVEVATQISIDDKGNSKTKRRITHADSFPPPSRQPGNNRNSVNYIPHASTTTASSVSFMPSTSYNLSTPISADPSTTWTLTQHIVKHMS